MFRDILARITRVLDAFRDGEHELAEAILDDLIAELWAKVEVDERLTPRRTAA